MSNFNLTQRTFSIFLIPKPCEFLRFIINYLFTFDNFGMEETSEVKALFIYLFILVVLILLCLLIKSAFCFF